MGFSLHSIDVVDYIYSCDSRVYVEISLHPWDKYMIIGNKFFQIAFGFGLLAFC
jgi:hypothetical protein